MHTYIHTYIYTYIHTYTYIYIHIYIHTHAYIYTHACQWRASPVGALGADVVFFRADVVCRPSCTHVFSGTDGDANLPLGSVNSIAFFSSVPVGKKCDSVQTVAVRLIGGGFSFPGTLKFTLALQNTGSIVACTVQLSRCRYEMESHIVSAQMPQKMQLTNNT